MITTANLQEIIELLGIGIGIGVAFGSVAFIVASIINMFFGIADG